VDAGLIVVMVILQQPRINNMNALICILGAKQMFVLMITEIMGKYVNLEIGVMMVV
jgi:hypothetical protein